MKKEKPKGFVITIDGPAGSGKSTVSAELAKRLRFVFLTTGAFYRGLAVLCASKNTDISNADEVAQMAHYEGFRVDADPAGTQVFVDEENVTEKLHTEQMAALASRISAYREVREALLYAQRAFNKPPGLVAEGRDCGTVIFPDAEVKIFLTASLDQRALRRSTDDKSASAGQHVQNLAKRDKADTQRKAAPLTKAPDAIEIDSSSLSVNEVVDRIEKIVVQKKADMAEDR